LPSVLLTLLVVRHEEHPACKKIAGVVICLERGAKKLLQSNRMCVKIIASQRWDVFESQCINGKIKKS